MKKVPSPTFPSFFDHQIILVTQNTWDWLRIGKLIIVWMQNNSKSEKNMRKFYGQRKLSSMAPLCCSQNFPWEMKKVPFPTFPSFFDQQIVLVTQNTWGCATQSTATFFVNRLLPDKRILFLLHKKMVCNDVSRFGVLRPYHW